MFVAKILFIYCCWRDTDDFRILHTKYINANAKKKSENFLIYEQKCVQKQMVFKNIIIVFIPTIKI